MPRTTVLAFFALRMVFFLVFLVAIIFLLSLRWPVVRRDSSTGQSRKQLQLLFDAVLRIAFGVWARRDLARRSTRSQYFVYSSEKLTHLRCG